MLWPPTEHTRRKTVTAMDVVYALELGFSIWVMFQIRVFFFFCNWQVIIILNRILEDVFIIMSILISWKFYTNWSLVALRNIWNLFFLFE